MQYFLILSLILLSPLAHAEEEVAPGELLSRYWLEDPLTISTTFGVPNHVFSLSADDSGSTQKNIDYSPPQATDLTLAVGYGQFNFSWKQPLPQSSASKGQYGRSTYDDFSFEWGRNRFATSLYYQTFSGFYTDLNGNTGNFARIGSGGSGSDTTSPSLRDNPSSVATPADIVKRGDISTRHYGAILWYAFPLVGENSQAFQLTFRSIVDTPGTGFNFDLVTSLFYDYAAVNASTPFVPARRSANFGRGAALQGIETYSGGTGVGFATSYAWSHVFVDGMFLYGGGAQRQHAKFTDDKTWNTAYVDNVNMKTGVGFRMKQHQAGLNFWVNSIGSRVSDIRFTQSNMAIELGYQLTI
jgi:hypothetical protein